MKKVYTLALSLFAATTLFAQTTITYECNVLRAGDVRNLKKTEYQDPGKGGANQVWDFSQSKETKEMTIRQTEDRTITSNNNLNLVCDEGGEKNTIFEISKSKKMYWGLENSVVKIKFNEPIVDLKFPFSYGEKVEGIMDGTYTENGKTNPIKGTYTTQVDAWGTVILPDGNSYQNVLRVKVEKNYTQTFQSVNGTESEYQISSVRYQYFAKGVRYPILIILESEVKSDCKCTCSNKIKEAYYEAPAFILQDFGKDAVAEKEDAVIRNFEYNVSPNPFENELRIAFSLSKNANIEINLVDINGKIVKQIVNEKTEKGEYVYSANTSGVIAGSYLIQIKVDQKIYVNKLVKK